MEHHAAGLDRLAKKERGVGFANAVKADYLTAPLTEREKALVQYALKLNDTPAAMEESDLQPMRAAGLSDPEILHGNLVVGYFAFANRLTLGLGVELENHELGN